MKIEEMIEVLEHAKGGGEVEEQPLSISGDPCDHLPWLRKPSKDIFDFRHMRYRKEVKLPLIDDRVVKVGDVAYYKSNGKKIVIAGFSPGSTYSIAQRDSLYDPIISFTRPEYLTLTNPLTEEKLSFTVSPIDRSELRYLHSEWNLFPENKYTFQVRDYDNGKIEFIKDEEKEGV